MGVGGYLAFGLNGDFVDFVGVTTPGFDGRKS